MRLSPKATTLTSAWPGPGVGRGVSGLMKRAEAGPLPPRISGIGPRRADVSARLPSRQAGSGRLTNGLHELGHCFCAEFLVLCRLGNVFDAGLFQQGGVASWTRQIHHHIEDFPVVSFSYSINDVNVSSDGICGLVRFPQAKICLHHLSRYSTSVPLRNLNDPLITSSTRAICG